MRRTCPIPQALKRPTTHVFARFHCIDLFPSLYFGEGLEVGSPNPYPNRENPPNPHKADPLCPYCTSRLLVALYERLEAENERACDVQALSLVRAIYLRLRLVTARLAPSSLKLIEDELSIQHKPENIYFTL